jgi:ABC-type antimicrobial peptide transport system permease subunit
MDGGSNDPVYAEDWSPQGGTPPIRRFKFISPGYVSVIGSHLLAGRELTWADLYSRAPVALISENLARELWRNPEAAVGKHVRAGPKAEWRQVIGVIANLSDDGIDRPSPAIVYWPLMLRQGQSDTANRSVAYVIRTSRAGSTALSQEIRQAVTAVNASLPLADVKTLQSMYEQSLARTSFTLMLLAIAGTMALILGVVGIYGTISFSVAQRTREVGIRLALGSPPREITAMFVRLGLAEAGAGLVCGLAAAFALTRLMKSVLFGVSPADPTTYLAASMALAAAAALASYLPAHQATRINPVEALRAE